MPDWKQYEGDVADGNYPLERYLGGSEASGVFVTWIASGRAAIKFQPAEPAQARELVERWNRAARLHHRHLAGIHAAGTWAPAGVPMAYVVMEYAEENLAEVLRDRALTSEETHDMLLPVADALAYLHGQGLAHGDLKPSNILAVEDTVKISCEQVSAGDPTADIRAFGMTVVQALKQRADTPDGIAVDDLPFPFREVAEGCLRDDARLRWSAEQIAAWLRSPELPAPFPAALPVAALPAPIRQAEEPAKGRMRPRHYIAAAGVVVVAAVVGSVAMRRTTGAGPVPIAGETVPPAPVASGPPPPSPAPRRTGSSDRVVEPSRVRPAVQDEITRRVLPNIPAKDRNTIRGKATEVVRVTVNAAGKVTEATLERSASPYFGKLVLEAARRWQFAAEEGAPRIWILHFELYRTNTQVTARRAGR